MIRLPIPGLLVCMLALCGVHTVRAQGFTSSNLPIVVINTNGNVIKDEPKIIADMGMIDNGPGVRNNIADVFNNYNGKIAIEIRGSSSQMFPKKQYAIELRADNGLDTTASLLSLPPDADWVLFAPYNDKSLMRDVLAYKMGRNMNRYAPRTRYCELVMNGTYQGIYVLMEKIKRDKNRVDINKLNPDEISGDDLSGGYIIKIDKTTGDTGLGWNSVFPPPDRGNIQVTTFYYEYPKYDEIAPAQKQYIQAYIAEFENALAGENFRDPVTGYAKYIDVESFVDFYIMNEVSKNVDGYRLSTFMHKHKKSDGGKLVMGPIWDFNLGFGNADYCTKGSIDGFVTAFNSICPNDSKLIPFWWTRLMEDYRFKEKVSQRWNALRKAEFKPDNIHSFIDSVAQVLNQESQQRNFQRWPVLGTYVWPNYYVGPTFQSEVDWLKNWVSGRMQWMDQRFPEITTSAEADRQRAGVALSVFPNPFDHQVQFEYSLDKPGEMQILVYDLVGNGIVQDRILHLQTGTYQYRLGDQIPPGVYYYTINFNGFKLFSGKLLKL